MKKIILTTAVFLGMGLASFANPNGGGALNRGETPKRGNRENTLFAPPKLPAHGQDTNQSAPIGSGIVVLTALGAAYLIGKRHDEE